MALWAVLVAVGIFAQIQQICSYLQAGNEQRSYSTPNICGGFWKVRTAVEEWADVWLKRMLRWQLVLGPIRSEYVRGGGLQRVVFPWFVKARFQRVVSTLAHSARGDEAAICRNRLS